MGTIKPPSPSFFQTLAALEANFKAAAVSSKLLAAGEQHTYLVRSEGTAFGGLGSKKLLVVIVEWFFGNKKLAHLPDGINKWGSKM